jgi:hypothetical protein
MPDRGMAGRPLSLDAEAVRDPPIPPWALTRGSPDRQVPADHCPELFPPPVGGAVAFACKRVADADRAEIARCSITARWARLRAISGYWTGRV